MERLIFKDPALNKRFTQEGYVILQLLTPSEVGESLWHISMNYQNPTATYLPLLLLIIYPPKEMLIFI
jgi:hypothetical protein